MRVAGVAIWSWLVVGFAAPLSAATVADETVSLAVFEYEEYQQPDVLLAAKPPAAKSAEKKAAEKKAADKKAADKKAADKKAADKKNARKQDKQTAKRKAGDQAAPVAPPNRLPPPPPLPPVVGPAPEPALAMPPAAVETPAPAIDAPAPAAPGWNAPAPCQIVGEAGPCRLSDGLDGCEEPCAAGCGCGRGLFGCSLGDPWRLPQPCALKRMGFAAGGWIQQGITVNGYDPADGFNGPVSTNDRADEYQLNQAWLFLHRPTKTDGCGFDIGGRIDALYGTDWRFGRNPGLEDRINSADNFYGMCLPQFYLEAAVNDLTVRMGHMATNFGYEVIPGPGNFFYSHSYAISYSEPLLVTGVQADYRLSEQLLLTGGFNRGWMMFEDFNHHYDFLGGLKWVEGDGTSLSFMTQIGPQDPLGDNDRFAYSLVYREQVTERFVYALQHNLGYERNVFYLPGTPDAEWYGINQHFIYTINPCWAAGLRFEWFRDDDGARVAGVGNWIGSDRGWRGGFGFAGNFFELTAGLNWKPHANFILRPEIRWDWYDGVAPAGQLPYNGGLSSRQVTAAADLIFTF